MAALLWFLLVLKLTERLWWPPPPATADPAVLAVRLFDAVAVAPLERALADGFEVEGPAADVVAPAVLSELGWRDPRELGCLPLLTRAEIVCYYFYWLELETVGRDVFVPGGCCAPPNIDECWLAVIFDFYTCYDAGGTCYYGIYLMAAVAFWGGWWLFTIYILPL